MPTYGFKDNADGFYQVELQDGESFPAWTFALTPLTEEERLAHISEESEAVALAQQREAIKSQFANTNVIQLAAEGDPQVQTLAQELKTQLDALQS